MDSQATSYIAIDIASKTLRVQTEQSGFETPNSAAGFAQALRRTKRLRGRHFVLEATGGYERELLDLLHERGETVSLVPAARVRDFARSEGVKAKTDPIDARMILRFAQEKRPRPTPAPTRRQRRMQALVDRREQLSEWLKRERTRLPKAAPEAREMIKSSIAFAQEQTAQIDALIRELVKSDQPMREAFKTLISIKGFGPVTSWTIIAHLPEITAFRRNEVSALVGVAPFNRDSGNREGPRSIFGGRSKIRNCLYMAAMAAARHNAVIKRFVDGLVERGKAKKCALVAAMRKMLIHAHALLKNNGIRLA